jgi:hypothetical protein
MDPITLALVYGSAFALQAAGTYFGSEAAEKNNEAQRRQAMLEQAAENERRKHMELVKRRQDREVVRNTQRMHALSTQVATSQGAQFGSGYAGGQAQITQDAGNNLLTLNQNLFYGRRIFDINAQISENRKNISDAQMDSQYAQGLSSLGSSLFNAAAPISRVATQFRPGQQSAPTFNPSTSRGAIY